MLQVKCPDCESIFDANDTVPQMSCPHCGKTYSNPYYKPVQAVPAQQHPINQPTETQTASQPQKPVQDQQDAAATQPQNPVQTQEPVQDQQDAAATQPQNPVQTQQEQKVAKTGKSEFTGGLGSLIGLKIVNCLIFIFTLGLGTPWVICRSYRWRVEHQIIDGHKIVFDGKGGQLFGQWIKWILLTIITLFIYSFWIPIKKLKWITEHSHIQY